MPEHLLWSRAAAIPIDIQMPRRIAIFQHAESEGPGYVRTWLELAGFEMDFVRWWKSPAQSAASIDSSWDGCVILGGAMNIYQHRDHPWLEQEKALISQLLSREVPILGICLGAQLLADQLGGRVFQNPHEEIGWWPIEFCAAAREIFPEFSREETFLHWHGDTFSLPQGAVPLGASSACSRQGFIYKKNVVAVQFHPEVDEPLLQDFCGDGTETWPSGPWVQSRQDILDQGQKLCRLGNAMMLPFLEHLFDGLRER
jgi:GMP synthase-like glutamine amidotransferase